MRLVARMELPSTRALTTATCLVKGSLFMSCIMPERSSIVKPFLCPRRGLFPKPPYRRNLFDLAEKRQYPRTPRPLNRGLDLTICIAAICENGHNIVSASDMKLSSTYFSADYLTQKVHKVYRNWWVLFAGNITDCNLILREVYDELITSTKEQLSFREIRDVFRHAYHSQLRMRREDQVLSPYGMTLKDFKKDGLRAFGEKIFGEFNQKLEAVNSTNFVAQFLVFGFISGRGHVFSVDFPGYVQDHRKPGFHAIGTGAYEALSMLNFRGFNIQTDLPQAVYEVCASKFTAEAASDVGEYTQVTVTKPDAGLVVDAHLIDSIRLAWDERVKHVPEPKIIEQIKEHVKIYKSDSTIPKEDVGGQT